MSHRAQCTDGIDNEHLPVEHAASAARIAAAEKNKLKKQSAQEHAEAQKEFEAALNAHETVFGKPIKRHGAWV